MSIRSRLGAAWSRVFRPRADASGGRQGGLELLKEMLGYGRSSKSGKVVNVDTALHVTIVLAVLQRIAFGVAQVPWKVFKERPDGRGRDEDRKHPLWRLLHRKPNDLQTSFSFRVTLIFHLLLTGNFFCFISRIRGVIVELIPLDPRSITVERQRDRSLKYFVIGEDGVRKEIPADAMWHIQGPSWNGWMGLEAVKLAREAIGLAMAAEETQSELQRRGARMPGVLAMEGNLNTEQYKDLAKWLKENAAAAFDELGILIVDRQAKFQSVTMSGAEAQTLETRRLQIEEVCRAFGLLPIMIGAGDKSATYASVEQMMIAHVVHTLDPWYVCIEQSAEVTLLDERADAGRSVAFIRAGLMRGAITDQGNYFAKALGVGATGKGQAWFTPNEVRELLEYNPIAGGDELPDPSAGKPAAPQPGPAAP